MKKIVLFFVLLTGLAVVGIAQSLQLSNNQGIIVANGEIIQLGSPDSSELITYMNVKNIGTADKHVLCRKTEIKMLDSTEITMCWAGGCYPPKTNLSPSAQLITAGQTNTEFVGHYTQMAFNHFKSGESVVRWCFFDQQNPNDSVSVLIKYTSYPLGISEKSGRVAELSNVYPNPASTRATVGFELPAGTSGTLVIRDMIGKTVYSEQLNGSFGKTVINTLDLSDGIYFCSLLVDGKSVQTRKMIVRH